MEQSLIMKIYLVGGACRDALLGISSRDKDFVVVGATEKEMEEKGFERVGRDFPVFLHPDTKDEYALAREERKCGFGHCGFSVNFSPTTTLEQDLIRRDLTMNAIAFDAETHRYVDPYGGINDIKNGIIRHTSEAFRDDPLRVLRTARFAAKMHSRGFKIHPDTFYLMKEMSESGELNYLTPERVWIETLKALDTKNPEIYFCVLLYVGALKIVFPELYALFGIPQPEKHHPEIDTFLHILMCLKQAAKEELSTTAKFAVLTHDLGKAITPKEILPSHHGHEEAGVDIIIKMCERLRIPNKYKNIAIKTSMYHLNIHKIQELNYKTLCDKLISLGAIGNFVQFVDILKACRCDARGRLGLENTPYPQYDFAIKCATTLQNINYKEIASLYSGDKLLQQIRKTRYAELKKIM